MCRKCANCRSHRAEEPDVSKPYLVCAVQKAIPKPKLHPDKEREELKKVGKRKGHTRLKGVQENKTETTENCAEIPGHQTSTHRSSSNKGNGSPHLETNMY